MKNYIVLIFSLALCVDNLAQNNIFDLQQSNHQIESPCHLHLFNQLEFKDLSQKDYIDRMDYMQIDQKQFLDLKEQKSSTLALDIEKHGVPTQLLMYRVEIIHPEYSLITDDGTVRTTNDNLFYHGVVANDPNSIVALSVYDDEIKILIADDGGNYQLSKSDGNHYKGYYSNELKEQNEFYCEYKETGEETPTPNGSINEKGYLQTGNCVDIYFELDYQSYLDNGSSVTAAENWATSIFNELAVLYANENIDLALSQIKVWNSVDPYRAENNVSGMMDKFAIQIKNNYNGRLAHLLSTRNLGGGIAWIDVLCSDYHSNGHWGPYAVSSSLQTSTNAFPNYSWNVNVIGHEMGHNFGSKHTHDCVWGPNNNIQIDDCAPEYFNLSPNPPCYNPSNPILPFQGGTIMSYCNAGSVGINFNKGFGNEPGALILSKYNSASCVTGSNCATGGGGGGNNTPPLTISCPSNVNGSYECNSSQTMPSISGTASSSGGQAPIMLNFTDQYAQQNSCGILLYRYWIATDANGSTATCRQTINLEDIERPTINCPSTIVRNAGASCTATVTWPTITASDNCDNSVTVTTSHNSGSSFPIGTTVVTATAMDDCSNVRSCTFNVTVRDQTKPVWNNCPSNITLDSNPNCGAIAYWTPPNASDNCSVTVSSSHNSGAVFGLGTTVVSYTATDPGGNKATCSFNVTIIDQCSNTVSINCPSTYNGNLNCDNNDYVPGRTGTATATGGVGNINVSYSDQFLSNSNCKIDIRRTWTATDQNGNSDSCNQRIILNDNMAPNIVNCPGSKLVNANGSCGANVSWSSISAMDDCDSQVDISSSHNSGSTFPLGNTLVVIVATDNCGNSSTCSFNVNVRDTSAPTLTNCPSDIVIPSDADCMANVSWSAPSANDQCNVTLSSTHQPNAQFGLGKTTVIYTATDQSGNTASCSFEVEVVDFCSNTLQLACPSNHQAGLNCAANPSITPNNTGLPQVSGGNGNVSTDYSDQTIEDNDCKLRINRTWTVADDTGNSRSCVQQIVFNQNKKPIINNCPQDMSIEALSACSHAVTWAAISASSVCDPDVSLTLSHQSGSSFNIGVTQVSVLATDQCGNTRSCSFDVEIKDTSAPSFDECPTEVQLFSDMECEAIAQWEAPVVTDACDFDLTVNIPLGTTLGLGVTTVIYTATDVYGNQSTCSFDVEVLDKCSASPVVIVCPDTFSGSKNCLDPNMDPSLTGAANYTEGVGLVNMDYTDQIMDDTDCKLTLSRSWTATDEDNNISNCVQLIILQDDQAPILTDMPDDLTVQANSDCQGLAYWSAIGISDDCDATAQITSSIPKNSVLDLGDHTITITGVDQCDNETTQTFVISVVDNKAPIFEVCPEDISLVSGIDCMAFAEWDLPVVTDDCAFEISSNYQSGTMFSDAITEVIYTATDASGNSSTCSFEILVDNICEHDAVSIICPDIFSDNSLCGDLTALSGQTGSATYVDGVGEVSMDYEDNLIIETLCKKEIHRTWIATDQANNSSSCVQVVLLIDDTPPSMDNLPNDFIVQANADCEGYAHWSTVEIEDECGQQLILNSTVNKGSYLPLGITEIEISTEDACGNSVTHQFAINVIDIKAPEFSNCPEDILIFTDADCTAFAEWEAPSVIDDCDITVTSNFNSADEFDAGMTRVIYTATDQSGNSSSCSFDVVVVDICNSAPVEMVCPADYEGAYDCNYPLPDMIDGGTATYNMGVGAVEMDYEDETISEDACGIVIKRNWFAEDQAGNFDHCEQIISLLDTEAPVFTYCPPSINMLTNNNCEAMPQWDAPQAIDLCGGHVNITTDPVMGSNFEVGSTVVQVTATDACGNSSYCDFTITVLDNSYPFMAACPDDIVIDALDGCHAEATWEVPQYSDNCGVQMQASHQSGDLFGIGETNVTYWVTDDQGNQTSCEFTVTVIGTCENGADPCQAELFVNSNPVDEGIYHAADQLHSDGLIDASTNVQFKAGQSLNFGLGFEVKQNASFEASIEECENE